MIFTCMLSSMLLEEGREEAVLASTQLGIGKLIAIPGVSGGEGREGPRGCLHAVPGSEVFVYHLPARQVAHSTGDLDSHVD